MKLSKLYSAITVDNEVIARGTSMDLEDALGMPRHTVARNVLYETEYFGLLIFLNEGANSTYEISNEEKEDCVLKGSKEEVASFLGVTVEHINKLVKRKFPSMEGFVVKKKIISEKVQILNPEKFEKIREEIKEKRRIWRGIYRCKK